jgi:hypothetical protein
MSRSAEALHRPALVEAPGVSLATRAAALRALAAELAERMAEEAEEFAAHLESAATRGDRQRRLAIARTEREIARIEHQNAAKLRDLNEGYELVEHLPKLPGTDCATDTPFPAAPAGPAR